MTGTSDAVDLRRMSNGDRLRALRPFEQRRIEFETTEPRALQGFLVAAADQLMGAGSVILIVALDGGRDVAIPAAQIRRLQAPASGGTR